MNLLVPTMGTNASWFVRYRDTSHELYFFNLL